MTINIKTITSSKLENSLNDFDLVYEEMHLPAEQSQRIWTCSLDVLERRFFFEFRLYPLSMKKYVTFTARGSSLTRWKYGAS